LIQGFTCLNIINPMNYTGNDTGNERFTWTLVCSGRVLGSKSSEGADNLLRLHKKKCKQCYDTNYTCVDETHMRPRIIKGENGVQQDKERYKALTQKLGELLNL